MLAPLFGRLGRVSRNVRIYLLATSVLGFTLDGGVFAVLFNLFLLRLDFGPEFIGQINSAGLLAFALSSIPAGALGARLGNRRMMLAGLAMMVGGGAVVPLAPLLMDGWVPMVLSVAYIILYTGLALYFVNSVPFVMDISSVAERSHAFSMQTALLALAAFGGALIGGHLPRLFSLLLRVPGDTPVVYGAGLFLAALLIAPAVWAILCIPQPVSEVEEGDAGESDAGEAQPARRWRWESTVLVTLLLLSVVRFFQVSGTATANTFFNVYMDSALHVPTANIGLVAALGRLLGVPAALVTPMLVARWGAPRTVILASAISTLSMVLLAVAPHWAGAGIGYIGVTAFSSMRYPAFLVYSMTLVPARWRGTLAGAGEMAGGLCFGGMALIGGFLIEAQGFFSLFLFGGVLTLVGTVLFLLWFMLPHSKPATAPVT